MVNMFLFLLLLRIIVLFPRSHITVVGLRLILLQYVVVSTLALVDLVGRILIQGWGKELLIQVFVIDRCLWRVFLELVWTQKNGWFNWKGVSIGQLGRVSPNLCPIVLRRSGVGCKYVTSWKRFASSGHRVRIGILLESFSQIGLWWLSATYIIDTLLALLRCHIFSQYSRSSWSLIL